jgi:L-arabinokinase
MTDDLHQLVTDLTSDDVLRGFFSPTEPVIVSRAPGRLDVMGGIADYSGSLVLQLPIAEAACVAMQLTGAPEWAIASLPTQQAAEPRVVSLDANQVRSLLANDYAHARDWFRQDAATAWAAYIAGVLLVLARERAVSIDTGVRIAVRSHVPEAKGVSSSAALEVATLRAACEYFPAALDGAEAARLCQMAENYVVGAPCGIMDQMTSAVGRAGELLALLCQPAEVQGFARLPDTVAVWGIDSGIRHAVSGSDYTSVRCGAFMGYRILAEQEGLPVQADERPGVLRIRDTQWSGYLANVTPAVFEQRYAAHLPVSMRGDEFLQRFGGTTDQVTRVDAQRQYAIRQPAAHPIYEHARVRRFQDLLGHAPTDDVLTEMGDLMYQSHASYSACGLGSAGTDQLVDMVRTAGPAAGLFGAKITGGGSGGTVAILGRTSAHQRVQEIADQYSRTTGREVYVFTGSSPGAWNHTTIRVSGQELGTNAGP